MQYQFCHKKQNLRSHKFLLDINDVNIKSYKCALTLHCFM